MGLTHTSYSFQVTRAIVERRIAIGARRLSGHTDHPIRSNTCAIKTIITVQIEPRGDHPDRQIKNQGRRFKAFFKTLIYGSHLDRTIAIQRARFRRFITPIKRSIRALHRESDDQDLMVTVRDEPFHHAIGRLQNEAL